MRALQWLTRLPLPVLVALPGAAATAVVAVAPGHGVLALSVVTLACFALGAALSWDLRQVGHGGRRLTRDVARVDRRTGAAHRRAAVLEHVVSTRDESAEAALARTRALLAELVDAEERTRAYIAAELHDTVAQTLSQALQQLRRGRAALGVESVADAETQLRDVLSRLRPPELVDGDLAQAVADLCRDLHQRYGVAVAVRWPRDSVALPVPVATTVYRFVQESLLNAAVHADGVGVRLHVAVEGDVLVAAVSDDGGGFEPSEVSSAVGRRVGLRLARERARLAGGRLEVQSRPGAGTTVTLRLPLHAAGVVQELPPEQRTHVAP